MPKRTCKEGIRKPPPPNSYVAHALMLARMVEYVRDHWCSFTAVMPMEALDRVWEDRVQNKFKELREELEKYAGWLSRHPQLSESVYKKKLAEINGSVDYTPVARLDEISSIIEQDESWNRATAAGAPLPN